VERKDGIMVASGCGGVVEKPVVRGQRRPWQTSDNSGEGRG